MKDKKRLSNFLKISYVDDKKLQKQPPEVFYKKGALKKFGESRVTF